MVKIRTIESMVWSPRRLTKRLEERLKKEFEEEATPEFINLVRVAYAAHEHALLHLASKHTSLPQYEITKENFLEWISGAWDAGEHQLRVYTMEEEGGVSNELGIALKFGDYLSLFGRRKGYLSSPTV